MKSFDRTSWGVAIVVWSGTAWEPSQMAQLYLFLYHVTGVDGSVIIDDSTKRSPHLVFNAQPKTNR